MIHWFLVLAILFHRSALAFDTYDVDPQPTSDPNVWIIKITIDSCTTEFKVPTKKIKSVESDPNAINQMVDIAEERANNGCS